MAGALLVSVAPTPSSRRASAALATLAPLSPATAKLVPNSGALWGAAANSRGSGDRMQAFNQLESQLGVSMDIHRIYSRWDSKQPSSYVKKDLAMGRTPVLSIVARKGGHPVSWRSIANGAHDRQIAAHADGLKSVRKPIILGFHHEPENDTGRNGSAADYAAAFRHYVQVFRARGATNVSFAFILVAWSFNDRSRYNPDAYYPGDNYIDWISADGYNPYGCHGPKWKSMEEVLTPFRDWARPHRKPLLIAEFGTRDMRGRPGAKADWLRDATKTFESWPEIKAVSYYHSSLGCGGWHLDGKDDIDAYADMGRALQDGPPGDPGSILPVIDSPAVSSSEPGQATVSANVSAGSEPVTVSVEYGVTRRYGSSIVVTPELPVGEDLTPLEAEISGLREGKTYHFRVVAEGAGGRAVSPDLTLGKEAAPVIKAARAANRTPTGATIKARIKGGSGGATWHVEYGQSPAYGDRTTAAALPAKRSRVATRLTGLRPGTRYHFRVVVSAGGQTIASGDKTFTTRVLRPPKVTNKRLRNVGRSTATYVGTAWLRGQAGTWWVEYGTTFQLASRTKASELAASSSGRELRRTLTRLRPGTKYYVRAVVSTAAGTFAGRTRAMIGTCGRPSAW